jgi:hypothetical protein
VPKKKQQTIAKRNREQAVAEKRRLKREKKQAVRAARAAGLDPEQVEYDPVRGEFVQPEPQVDEPPAELESSEPESSEPESRQPD